jgi:RNA polymerase sigma-70 factor (ECF subfamily)
LLRRYGLALARDNRLVCDERSARALVENLSKRALLAARNGEGATQADARLRLFSLFIRFYRRHARLAAAEEGASEIGPIPYSGAPDQRDSISDWESAISGLPLELREALLLVVLERFSHVEAAQALDISLAVLIERLARARAFLAAELSRKPVPGSNRSGAHPSQRGASHLRLVK